MNSIKIESAPTRRSIFNAPDTIRYTGLTRKRLEELGAEFVDITDINGEGLLYDEGDRLKIEEKFCREGTDRPFFPHCNFGTKYVMARVAWNLSVLILLWEPRDERPDESRVRLRDSQCDLFAIGKMLRRFRVPFTYMTNRRLEDAEFERGIRDFPAVCNAVRVFRSTRILRIAPRPFDFWSIMCNEGELLEEFNIQLAPVPVPELTAQVRLAKEESREVECVMEYCRQIMDVKAKEGEPEDMAVMKAVMKRPVVKYGCNVVVIQCWNALQGRLGIMPCATNSLLSEERPPVMCEMDIYGAITAVIAEVAAMDGTRGSFADWTMRHPDNENGELLRHCDPWPTSMAQEEPVTGCPLTFDHPRAVEVLARYGDVTLTGFNGDNGEYSMLTGSTKGIEGPYTKGTYLWVEVENLKRLEDKLICGPYIHHRVGIHRRVVPVLYEAYKYIGAKSDLYDPIEEEIKAYVRGE